MGALNPSRLGNQKNKNGKNKYKQGYFVPKNLKKYVGQTPIVFRSSWEKAFCIFCDINDNILKWSTESIIIPYQLPNRKTGKVESHRYIPDFWVEMKSPTDPDRYDRMVIEIKPKNQTLPPKPPKKQTLKMLENFEYALITYKKNLYKWATAKEWCEKKHVKFVIVTEDDLRKKGLIK